MLDDNRWIFLVVSTVMIIAITFYVIKYRPQNKWAYAACAFVVGGGIGNMIDRVALGYVIDFIDFCAFPKIWYYVFNVADSFVCVGAGMLMVYLVFSIVTESRAEKAIKLDERGDDKAPDDQGGAEPENAVLADAESDTVISEDTDSSDTAESEESAGDE